MSDTPRLIEISGAKPREFALVKSEIRIGSETGNDLVIDEATVSRRHAVMWAHAGAFRLTDMNSANGTFVNGRRVVGSAVLSNGDEIKFGAASYRVAGVGAIGDPPQAMAGVASAESSTAGLAAAKAASPAMHSAMPVRTVVVARQIPGPGAMRSRRAKRRRRATAIAAAIVGAGLLFAIGFIFTDYVVNFSRMETAAEDAAQPTPHAAPSLSARASTAPPVSSGSVSTAAGAARSPVRRTAERKRLNPAVAHDGAPPLSPAAAATSAAWIANPPSVEVPGTAPGWLAAINRYRQTAHLDAVTIDPSLKTGAENHARYLILNYLPVLKRDVNLGAVMHTEDPAKPYYTSAGKAAAAAADVNFLVGPPDFRPGSPSWAIDSWMTGPFHRMWILNPWLRQVGYGEYCSQGVCSAVLNVLSDSAQPPFTAPPFVTPIEFPADKAVTTLRQVEGEWPDPAAPCPGYESPSGLPITLELGVQIDPRLSAYTLTLEGTAPAEIEACGYTAATYVNPDASAQTRARGLLRTFGAVVVVPRAPLVPGSYTVAITAAGRQYKWSFTVR
ncbi:MAG: FHA domain-containing protein [Candidatus Binataceae bacterium]